MVVPMVIHQRVSKIRHGQSKNCMKTAIRSCFPCRRSVDTTASEWHGPSLQTINDDPNTPRASIAGSCSMWTPASKRDQDVRCTLGYETGTTKRAMWRHLVHRSLSYGVRTFCERWWLGQGRLGTVVGGAGRLRQQQPLRGRLSLKRLRQKFTGPSKYSG